MYGDFVEQAIAASRRQAPLDLATSGLRRVRANDLRLLLGGVAQDVDPYGIALCNGAISGVLDLRAMHVPFPLRIERCKLDSCIEMDGSTLHSFALIDSECPGLLANGTTVARDFDLSDSRIYGAFSTKASASMTSAIWLSEAKIGGRLLCEGTTIDTLADRAFHADSASFGGNIRFINNFQSNAELRFIRARVTGSIDLAGAVITSGPSSARNGGRALDLAESRIDGSLFFLESKERRQPTQITGRVEMGHIEIGGRLTIRGASFVAPPEGQGGHHYLRPLGVERDAIWAPRLKVAGDLAIEGGSHIDGGVDLTMCEIGGSLTAKDQHFANPGRVAINLTSAVIAGDVALGALPRSDEKGELSSVVEGSLIVCDAVVGGSLDASGRSFSQPAVTRPNGQVQPLVDGSGIRLGRDLGLRGIRTDAGVIRFGGARVGGDVTLDGATLRNPGGRSATFRQAVIDGSVLLRQSVQAGSSPVPFQSSGLLAFNHAKIGGRLLFEGSKLEWTGPSTPFNRYGAAIEAIETTIGGGIELGWQNVMGVVDFTGSTTSYLADRPGTWGDTIRVAGFQYDRFAPVSGDALVSDGEWGVDARADWLRKQRPFGTGPYEQAASVMRARGLQREADELLIRGRRDLRQSTEHRPEDRKGRRLLRSSLDWGYDRLFGYGHRPGRALVALAFLIVMTAVPAQVAFDQNVLRAADNAGNVYTSAGTLAGGGVGTTGSGGSGPPGVYQCGDGQVRCFNAWLFAADTVVPILDLGQRSEWRPVVDPPIGVFYECWFALMTGLGLTFSAVGALSFGRLGRSSTTG